MMTQSVGVPLTAKRRSPISRSRSGSLSESECDTPDWSNSGAITQTSSDKARPISAQTSSPSEWMPSSLVIRMRMSSDHVEPAHVRTQHIRHRDRAVRLLVGLHHRDQRAADGDAGAVERVHEARLAVVLAAEARVHAPGLELAAQRARGNLPVHVLPGQPDLDIVGLLRGKAHVAGAEGDHAIMQVEPPQNFLGAGEHALVLVARLFRRGDRDQLDLGELVLADHAAGVFAGGAGLGAEAW